MEMSGKERLSGLPLRSVKVKVVAKWVCGGRELNIETARESQCGGEPVDGAWTSCFS